MTTSTVSTLDGIVSTLDGIVSTQTTMATNEELMYQACIDGQFIVVEKLVKENENISEYSHKNNMFEDALSHRHFDIVDLLIKYGINVDYYHVINTMCARRDIDAIKYLVEKHNVILTVDNMLYAFIYTAYQIIKYMVECGVDIHYNDNEALKISYKGNMIGNINFMLKSGYINEDGIRDILVNAGTYGQTEIIKLLIENKHIDKNHHYVDFAIAHAKMNENFTEDTIKYLHDIRTVAR